MATEEKKESNQDNEIAKELILDLDEPMKITIKDLIRKAFTEETTFIKMCDLIKAKLVEKEDICNKILKEFGLKEKNSHIINGHIPVKEKDGERRGRGIF